MFDGRLQPVAPAALRTQSANLSRTKLRQNLTQYWCAVPVKTVAGFSGWMEQLILMDRGENLLGTMYNAVKETESVVDTHQYRKIATMAAEHNPPGFCRRFYYWALVD